MLADRPSWPTVNAAAAAAAATLMRVGHCATRPNPEPSPLN